MTERGVRIQFLDQHNQVLETRDVPVEIAVIVPLGALTMAVIGTYERGSDA